MLKQLGLFPLSAVKPVGRPSGAQLLLLDLIALRDGVYLGEIPNSQRVTLRHLMTKKLVECVKLGPAIYVLTPSGRIARGRR